jgi:hypothetical protein
MPEVRCRQIGWKTRQLPVKAVDGAVVPPLLRRIIATCGEQHEGSGVASAAHDGARRGAARQLRRLPAMLGAVKNFAEQDRLADSAGLPQQCA